MAMTSLGATSWSSRRSVFRRDADWPYKSATIYENPKILIRQAGVGIWATYDETGAWCPQSVYLYRLRPDLAAQGSTINSSWQRCRAERWRTTY